MTHMQPRSLWNFCFLRALSTENLFCLLFLILQKHNWLFETILVWFGWEHWYLKFSLFCFFIFCKTVWLKIITVHYQTHLDTSDNTWYIFCVLSFITCLYEVISVWIQSFWCIVFWLSIHCVCVQYHVLFHILYQIKYFSLY